jgi:enterochelin esterase-like enzyme
MKFRTIERSSEDLSKPGLHFVTVKSVALKGRVDISIYVPGHKSKPDSTWPFYFLLHGVYGSHWGWPLKGKAHENFQRLVDQKKIKPAVLIMPSDGLLGDGSGYFNTRQYAAEDWICKELPELCRQLFPRKNSELEVFLCGLSMGGWASLRLGMLYPKLFAGISAHSSMSRLSELDDLAEENWSGKPALKKQVDLLQLIPKLAAKMPPMRMDCGLDDPLLAANREVHMAFQNAGLDFEYKELKGAHDWKYWSRNIRRSFEFFEALRS